MCGLLQSILATVPDTVTGLSPSYSAANEWWAEAGDVAISSPTAKPAIPFIPGVLLAQKEPSRVSQADATPKSGRRKDARWRAVLRQNSVRQHTRVRPQVILTKS